MSFLKFVFHFQVETFRECRTMVRRPLLDVLNCWKVINADFPVTRFLLYGKNGCGKTITLAQLVHAAILQKYVVSRDWNRNLSGIAPSTWKVGRIDLPLEAAAWLTNFKAVNESLITEDYVWSTRETSESGQPLMSVVETGINRPRFASDCIAHNKHYFCAYGHCVGRSSVLALFGVGA
ncbi:unnamed protein product [Soboliphyme baturini]|uniref:Small ribosomal subunit protein mS29 n=1 Tax=Soboliphyme baturini TaxID=241478 RepID=A0A183IRX3_9BILA|nr:unnamed protein product [Soboliphyme baturini]